VAIWQSIVSADSPVPVAEAMPNEQNAADGRGSVMLSSQVRSHPPLILGVKCPIKEEADGKDI
jgi:hypothetical protein